MKLNRRNFLQVILATLAAAVTRKWPEIEWPEAVRRAAGNIIYIDPRRGSDANSGKEDAPLCTLQAALGRVEIGGAIYLASGCYREELDANKDGAWLIGDGSGVPLGDADEERERAAHISRERTHF